MFFFVAVAACAIFVRSPFGAALAGTRDQPRRMNALGFHVWMIRFGAFMFSGLLTAVAGILFVYYNKFISPQTLALPASAEALLMVISGGAGTLLGPIVGAALVVIIKNVVSAYVVRWNFMLGAIFVAIVVFMPEGLVPGMARLSRSAWRAMSGAKKPLPARGAESHDRACRQRFEQIVRRPARHRQRQSESRAGRAPADHRAERRRQDHAVQSDHRRTCARTAARSNCSTATSPGWRAASAPISAWRAPIRSSRCSPATRFCAMRPWRCSGCRRCAGTLTRRCIASSIWSTQARAALKRVGLDHIADRPLAETSYGEKRRVEIAMALAQNPKVLLLDEPFAGLSIDERRDVRQLLTSIPRDVTIVMIEHDMDTALELADRITLLHFGEVIVEGTRAEVVADPRTREVYLGE